jgi:hypothetical protein
MVALGIRVDISEMGFLKEMTKYILDPLDLLTTKNRLYPRPFSANVTAMAPKILVKCFFKLFIYGYDNFRTKVAVLARSQNIFSVSSHLQDFVSVKDFSTGPS